MCFPRMVLIIGRCHCRKYSNQMLLRLLPSTLYCKRQMSLFNVPLHDVGRWRQKMRFGQEVIKDSFKEGHSCSIQLYKIFRHHKNDCGNKFKSLNVPVHINVFLNYEVWKSCATDMIQNLTKLRTFIHFHKTLKNILVSINVHTQKNSSSIMDYIGLNHVYRAVHE